MRARQGKTVPARNWTGRFRYGAQWLSKFKWGIAVVFDLLAVSSIAIGSQADGERQEDQLGAYLRKLRYEPVVFTRAEQSHPLVEIEIHGKKLSLLVDSGACTLLEPRRVSGLKTLGELGVVLEDKVFGPITNSSVVLIDEMTIGRAHFSNQPAFFMAGVSGVSDARTSGILGLDFLARNHCLVDCGSHRIFLRAGPPSAAEAEAMEETFRRSGFAQVNLNTSVRATIDIEINGISTRLIVDTGSAFSLLDQSQLKRLKLRTLRQQQAQSGTIRPLNDVGGAITGVGSIGLHALRVAKVSDVKVGERNWKEVYFGIADLSDWQIGKAGTPVSDVQGLLGCDLLMSTGALIDFESGKLWLRPEKPAKH